MFIIKQRKFFFIISAILVLLSIFAIYQIGIPLGIEFTGGTIIELNYDIAANRPASNELSTKLADLDLGQVLIQPLGDKAFLLRLKTINESEKENLVSISGGSEARYSSIGPSLGRELARKGVIALILTMILIIIYIAFVFRKVSLAALAGEAVSSWKYGVIAVVALVHDAFIATGFMVFLSKVLGLEADSLFLTALLMIIGLSVNDTIVVFDRIRENLRHPEGRHFDELVGKSILETMARSINTSLAVVLVLMAIYFLGAAGTKNFALIMTVGLIVGTYSSIFLASPLLVTWQKFTARRAERKG